MNKKYGLSWISAHYFSAIIFEYLMQLLDNSPKKIPKKLFDFSEKNIDQIGGDLCKDFFFLDAVKLPSLLNSISIFAQYLFLSGIANEEEVKCIQNDTKNIFDKIYPNLVKNNTESIVFEGFPFLKEVD